MRGGAHLTGIVQVRVVRDDCPLGGLWVRQLGGLIDGGVDGAGEGIASVGDRPMRRVPRVMRQFIIQRGRVAKGLGGVVFIHRVFWMEDKGRGRGRGCVGAVGRRRTGEGIYQMSEG